MAVESATYIGDLNASNPPGTDVVAEGDNVLRLIKTTLQNTFPSATGVWTALAHTWTAAQTISLSASGTALELVSTNAGSTQGPILSLYRDSATPLASDQLGGISWYGEDSAGNKTQYAGIGVTLTDPTNTSEDSILYFSVMTAGSYASELALLGTALYPITNDGLALGFATLSFSDLFLASGGVINWNNGDVTVTHASNTLAFAGASTAYTFADGPVRPASNDGAALGVSGTAWSDLFLASGAVINFNAGDVTVTHSSNTLAFAGASSGYTFDAAVSISGASVEPGASRASFRAHKNGSNQAVGSTSETQVTFGTEVYDVGSKFSSSAWTPPAGKVIIGVNALVENVTSGTVAVRIKRDSTVIAEYLSGAGTAVDLVSLVTIDDANGSNVYTVHVKTSADSSYSVYGAAVNTYFWGAMA